MRSNAFLEGCAIVLAAVVVIGCGGDAPSVDAHQPDPGDKTGGQSGPITITVVDRQPQGKPSNLPLAEFADQVATRSGGSMAVTVAADKLGDATPPPSDAEVIDGVRNGVFQMAVVPARAWSDAGVTSFRALQAPFLIESDEQAAAIVSDDSITGPMISGLEGTGVTGLVLYPEGLRHLFGFGEPILAPADMDGGQIRAEPSSDTNAIIGALGGETIEVAEYAEMASGIRDGTIRGLESSFALMSEESWLPIATGNVVPYAKLDSLVVNDAFWESLTDAQRTIIHDAADATRAWAITNLVKDADAAASYCETGGTVVLADSGSVDRFHAAASGVTTELAKDPTTDGLMTKMRAAATGLSPQPVESCEAPIAMTIKPDGGVLPDGKYRTQYTDDYLAGWGVTDINFQHGIYDWQLEDGHWTLVQRADDMTDHDEGIYQVKGRDLYWRWDEDPGKPIDHLTWSVAPNGDLTFAATPESPGGWTFARPLIRIGPLPD